MTMVGVEERLADVYIASAAFPSPQPLSKDTLSMGASIPLLPQARTRIPAAHTCRVRGFGKKSDPPSLL